MNRDWLGPLVVIIFGAALAVAWMFATPIFAEPDEEVHLDYALTLAHRGWPLSVPAPTYRTDADPLLRELELLLHYREQRFDATYRVRDQRSPALLREMRVGIAAIGNDRTRPLPNYTVNYPFGFYLVAAEAYRAGRSIFHLDRVDAVRGLRLLGVLALAVTLAAGYGSFRRLHFSKRNTVLAMLALAAFPMSSWVSAMVQPDTFTTALVTLALYYALGIRYRSDPIVSYSLFTIACVALAFVKIHYAVLVFFGLLPVQLSAIILRPTRIRLASTALSTILVIGAVIVSLHTLQHPNGNSNHPSIGSLLDAGKWFGDISQVYLDGLTHDSFWFRRDWPDTEFFSESMLGVIRQVLSFASCVAGILVLANVCAVSARLLRASRRHPRISIALALSDGVFWLYLSWTGGLMALDIMLGHFGLLGRYWLPVFVPMLALVSRAFTFSRSRRVRVRVQTGVLGLWLAYALVAAPCAFWQMELRFYGPPVPRTVFDHYMNIQQIHDSRGTVFTTNPIQLAPGSNLCFRGLAIDSRFGVPAKKMFVQVDDKDYSLIYGLPVRAPYNFNDNALTNIGFAGCAATARLGAGAHTARLIVIARDMARLRWPTDFQLIVSATQHSFRPLHLIAMQSRNPNIHAEIAKQNREKSHDR